MALELKGLKAKAIKAAANIDRLNVAYDKFNEMAPAHAADIEGLAPQVEGLVEDLTFAAQTLGNSAGASQDSQPKPPVSQAGQSAVHQGEDKQTAPATLPDPALHVGTAPQQHTAPSASNWVPPR